MKFVALSDLHVVPKGATSRGLDTAERLGQALDDIVHHHADADFCVLCGDLADHGEVEAYRHLKAAIADFPLPLQLMIGNHDDRANFRRVFDDAAVDDDGFVQSVVDTADGRFVFCDSHEPGRVDGRLCERRLAWLAARLQEAAAAGREAFVFVHHPLWQAGTRTDALGMSDPHLAGEVLTAAGNVRHLFAGHTHRMASGVWRGIPFATFGATHYNNGLRLNGRPGAAPRFAAPAYSAVVLVDAEQVVVHANEFLHDNPTLDDSHFDEGKIERLIAAGGRISALSE